MILKRISYSLALQFTAFVFVLLLVAGAVFLAGDVAQRSREANMRLERQLQQIMSRPVGSRGIPDLPRFQRERIRITDALGKTIYAGAVFDGVTFVPRRGLSRIESGRESFDVLTAPFVEGGDIVGYIQVAERAPLDDVGSRVFLFLVVSAAISAAAFGAGLFFARRSLRPAEQMMERLEQFTQDASHELRTPITAVSTSLDLALATVDNKDLVRAAKRDLKDMATLVERLLELARLDSFVLQTAPVDLSAAVNAVLDAHAHEADARGVVLERAVAANVRAQADEALVRRVVANLVSNALKFTPTGGRVSVTLTKDSLIVKDTGRGISPDALPRIFDRFFREDVARSKQSDGLGLGLALTKRIVDLHRWKILVESTPGKRTVFIVKF